MTKFIYFVSPEEVAFLKAHAKDPPLDCVVVDHRGVPAESTGAIEPIPISAQQAQAAASEVKPTARPPQKRPARVTLNVRMLAEVGDTPESVNWTAREWAANLGCSAAAAAKTSAFRSFQDIRERDKQERAETLRRQLPVPGGKRRANLVLDGETDEES